MPKIVIRALTCPICEKELPPESAGESRWLPFCSERCRNVDLYRWSEGRYAIVEPLSPLDDETLNTFEGSDVDEGDRSRLE